MRRLLGRLLTTPLPATPVDDLDLSCSLDELLGSGTVLDLIDCGTQFRLYSDGPYNCGDPTIEVVLYGEDEPAPQITVRIED